MSLDLDGGLIWLDFHVHAGAQIRASYYNFTNNQSIWDEELEIIRHYAIPIGQTVLGQSIQVFQINKDLFGFSLYFELPQEINKINAVSLMWVSSKNFNPFQILNSLKSILSSFDALNPIINNEVLQQISDNIIQNKGNMNITLLDNNNQEIRLTSHVNPNLNNEPVENLLKNNS